MLKLKQVLKQARTSQSDLARSLNVSPATVTLITNYGKWPKTMDKDEMQSRIRDRLIEAGVAPDVLSEVFNEVGESCANTTRPVSQPEASDDQSSEEDSMLLRKQVLTQNAKKHFGLFRDPFQNDVQCAEDMFLNQDIRYVYVAMQQTAKNGGILGVEGESGSGKTTLVRALEDWISRETQPIIIIRPYVLAMEDNDQKGKTLKATHIAEAIMAAVAPTEKVKSSPEARFAQLHKALKESHVAGYRHCLLIDEAHSLPLPTIKHLKRFFELEAGFTKLLSIILVGQSELREKLDERNRNIREVVQRCELVRLEPLSGSSLTEYLKLKFARIGKPLDEVIDEAGIEALRARLTFTNSRRSGDRSETVSLVYPLVVGNFLTACMNLAAEVGAPLVSADVVKGV